VERVVLGNGNSHRGSVDLAGRRLDDPRFQSTSRLEHVQSSFHVRSDELWVPVRVRDRDERAEVENDFGPGNRSGDRLGIREVTREDLELFSTFGSQNSRQP
jgi:hypothetical protein